jgi:hypothetical protein
MGFSPQSHGGRGEEIFCPFARDSANGQVARALLVQDQELSHYGKCHTTGGTAVSNAKGVKATDNELNNNIQKQ